jgi:hypothetical protein
MELFSCQIFIFIEKQIKWLLNEYTKIIKLYNKNSYATLLNYN